jgi:hypothetical protein
MILLTHFRVHTIYIYILLQSYVPKDAISSEQPNHLLYCSQLGIFIFMLKRYSNMLWYTCIITRE